MGEFGRTPKINSQTSRDHWPQCYTVLLAGGGVKRGFVYGASDKQGAYPAKDPVRPDDLAATVFHLLGIDPHTEVRGLGDRPVTISEGKTLALYPVYAWNEYVQYLESLGRGVEVSKFRTRITSMAKLSVLDAQNRISLTAEQMAYAGISGEVTFVGDGKRVRLWAPDKYAQQVEVISPDEEKQFENWF